MTPARLNFSKIKLLKILCKQNTAIIMDLFAKVSLFIKIGILAVFLVLLQKGYLAEVSNYLFTIKVVSPFSKKAIICLAAATAALILASEV